MFKCPYCNFETESSVKISRHISVTYGVSVKQACIDMFYNGVEPKCGCGCGKDVKFYSIARKFATFSPGHQSRVKNNWGHNKKALEKSHTTMRKLRASGDIEVWNKGLKKETDERVKSNAESVSRTIKSDPEKIKARSTRMRKHRLDGTIRTVTGKEHGNWKGGTSPLSATCHGHSRLYNEWKYPKLKAADFKCTRCESSDRLCVHHDDKHMSEIIREVAEKHGWENKEDQQDLKSIIANDVAQYHLDNDVSGIVLCHDCHEDEHPSLNL